MHFSAKKSYSPRFLLHRSGMVSLCSRSSSDNKRPLRTGASVWHRYRLQSSRKPSCFAKFHLTKDQIFSVFCNNVNLRITAAEIILQYPISLLFQKFTCYFFIFCTGPSPVFFILQSPFGSDLLPVLTDFYTKCPIKLLLWIGVGPSV